MKLIQVHVHALKQDMSASDIGQNIFVVIFRPLHSIIVGISVYTNNFYDTSVIFCYFIISYREIFTSPS